MTQIMLASRDLKRVPLDFDWPLDKVWHGYLAGPEFDFPQCPACEGDGLTREARAIERSFYPHMIESRWGDPERRKIAETIAWGDKLGQAEVDHLLEEGRLPTWVQDDSERHGHWEAKPLTAAEVNERQHAHDAINRWILVRFRCNQLGITLECLGCEGHGSIATPEQRQAYDEWKPTEPPAGPGFQLWESVSEGAPVSPVFATVEQLAEWLTDHADIAGQQYDYGDWLRLLGGEAHGLEIHSGRLV